jgi:hypothetical protein
MACIYFFFPVDFSMLSSFLIGILGSFIAWFIVSRILVPRIRFAEKISEIGKRQPRLRLKVRNEGYRDILDCEVMAELRIRGLDRELPKNISVLNIPIYAPRFPRLPSSRNRLITFRSYTFDDEAARLLPSDFGNHKDLSLSELFRLKGVIGLRVTLFGYDNFSGSRKAFSSRPYTVSDIESRSYLKNSLDLARSSEQPDGEDPDDAN